MTNKIREVVLMPSLQISKQDNNKNNNGNNRDEKEKPLTKEKKDNISENKEEKDLIYKLKVENLMLERRNTELHIFSKLREKKVNIENELMNIEEKISSLELNNQSNEDLSVNIDENIIRLLELKKLYFDYTGLIEEENQILKENKFDSIDEILEEKNKLLLKINKLQDTINFELFSKLEDNSEKKIKADKLLDDIHTRTTGILDKENENGVMIKNQKDKILQELKKSRKGMHTISKYSTVQKKSHFINTVR